jgi:hypothetical protein
MTGVMRQKSAAAIVQTGPWISLCLEGPNINQGGVMLIFIDGEACVEQEVIDGR